MRTHRGSALALAAVAGAAALLGAAFAPPVAAADTPPRDLHQVGDHWTAWSPPASFPEGAEVYEIVPGDTLWDLAGRFYGDPYLWPQLWEQNQYVLDAHWIYPGDPLLIGLGVETVPPPAEVAAGIGEDPWTPEEGDGGDDRFRSLVTAEEAAGAPVPLGAASDIYCAGFLGPDEEEFPYHLVGSEYGALMPELRGTAGDVGAGGIDDTIVARFNLTTGDIVYLGGPALGSLSPGELLTVVEPQDLVRHPLDRDELLGRFYRYRAQVRVLSVQEQTAIGEIKEACGPLQVGAMLLPFQAEPIPLGRSTMPRPVNLPAAAEDLVEAPAIVHAVEPVVSLGEGHMVLFDRSAADDVIPGDVYTIYRENRDGLPPIVLGELAVLSIEGEAALGRITSARYPVYLGDRLERK